MARPRKAPPRSPEEKRFVELLGITPVEEWPKEVVPALRSALNVAIEMARSGDKRFKPFLDMLAQAYVGHPDPMVAYLAEQATRRRGPRPTISDAELRNAWARCRHKKPKATATDLAKMLAREGLPAFTTDYLRRRLQRLP